MIRAINPTHTKDSNTGAHLEAMYVGMTNPIKRASGTVGPFSIVGKMTHILTVVGMLKTNDLGNHQYRSPTIVAVQTHLDHLQGLSFRCTPSFRTLV
jgi:hypothetical protein